MNAKRFFLLFLLVFAVTAILASCEFLPAGLFPGGATTTEATSQTTSEVTTMTTTEAAATTTAPVTSGAPAVPSQGGIKKATELASGAIRVTYGTGSIQSLGSLKLREGYNSAKVTALSLDDGVLTLTLLEAAGENVANRHLACAPSAVTLRLRERNGALEWADATGDDWRVLCPAKLGVGDPLPLPLLAEAAEVGKVAPATGTGVILSVNGDKLRFRATDWLREGYDLCSDAEFNRPNRNPIFMMNGMYEVPSTADKGFMGRTEGEGALLWKYTGDDIPSIMFNGTYIGAQHGYSLLIKIPNAGKTEADIGSVWENKNGQKYCLVKVVDGMLWLCPFDEDVMKDGDFSKYSKTRYAFVAAGDTLSHVEGATNTANIIATADAITNANDIQFYVSTIKIEQHLLLNGTVEVPLNKKGVYEAEFIDIYEVYEIAYLPAVLTYLMEHAGDNDNETCHSEEITETYMRFSTTHRYHRNGSCTVYQENEALKVLKNVDFYGMTSAAFADPSYVYVPGSVSAATMQKQEKVEFRVTGDPNLVRNYYQFDDLLGTRGFAIGYYPYFGVATHENRPLAAGNGNASSTNCGWYSAGQKNYPNLIKRAEMQPGEKIAFIGYRSPSVPIDDDFFAINWYFVGDEVMLFLNTDKAVGEKSVTLPDYLDGLTVTVAQKSDSFTVVSDTVDGGVTVSSTGAGYAILRLTPER